MDRFLGRYSAYIYAIVRIVVGFLFLLHGTQKLLGYPPFPPMPSGAPPDPLMMTLLPVGAIIEVVAGLLIFVGFFAGIAAFFASGEMAVAYFLVHQKGGLWPTTNG